MKPRNWAATSSSLLALGTPRVKPVPTGCSTHSIFAARFHANLLGTGLNVPGCQRNGPFSCSRPSSELQPGPPLSQMTSSSVAALARVLGKNQKKSSRVSPSSPEMGSNPEYDSPASKSTFGIEVPGT